MLAYFARRMLYVIPVVLGVALITFILFHAVGGDPSYEFLGKGASAEDLKEIRKQLGFDRPLFIDLDHWWNRYYTPRAERILRQMDRELIGMERWKHLPEEKIPQLEEGDADWKKLRNKGIPETSALPEESYYRHAVKYEVALASLQNKLLRMGKFAVAPLVTTVIFHPHISLKSRASRLLQQIIFVTRLVRPEDSPERINETVTWWRQWWDKHRADYLFPRSLRRSASSLLDSQFTFYLRQIATLDFGPSFVKNKKISELIAEGIGPSLSLAVPAFIFGTLLSLIFSLISAFWHNTWIDRTMIILTVMGMSVSMLVYIIAGQYFLAFKWRWFPIQGFMPGWQSLAYLILPGLIWIISSLGADVRLYRTIMLDETNQDYVRTARAKGVGPTSLLFKHVLKNAMIPILTRLVISLPFLYTGSLLLENFFGIPGLGSLAIEALTTSDFPVIKAIVFIGSLLFVLGNLLTDICYALVDPRVKLE